MFSMVTRELRHPIMDAPVTWQSTLGREQRQQREAGTEERDAVKSTRGDVVQGRPILGRLCGQQKKARAVQGRESGQTETGPSPSQIPGGAGEGAAGSAADHAVVVISAI